MAKARKEGKPKRNRANFVKKTKRLERNAELIKQFEK